MSAREAYMVELDGAQSICFGSTKAAAKWQAVASWREAGYGKRGEWPKSLKAVRRPEYDGYPWADRRVAWTEEAVRLHFRGRA